MFLGGPPARMQQSKANPTILPEDPPLESNYLHSTWGVPVRVCVLTCNAHSGDARKRCDASQADDSSGCGDRACMVPHPKSTREARHAQKNQKWSPCGPPQSKILDKELHIFSTCTPRSIAHMAVASLSCTFTAGASQCIEPDGVAAPAVGQNARQSYR